MIMIIIIIIIIIINAKSFRRDIFAGFQKHFFKKKLTFMKKAVLYTTTPMHCKATQVLRDILVLPKEIAQK